MVVFQGSAKIKSKNLHVENMSACQINLENAKTSNPAASVFNSWSFPEGNIANFLVLFFKMDILISLTNFRQFYSSTKGAILNVKPVFPKSTNFEDIYIKNILG